MEIHEITVATRNPSGADGDLGTCEHGFYTAERGLLTLVNADGVALRRANGERITANAAPGEERKIAARLVLAHWRATDRASDFNRPLHYGSHGWC